MYFAYVVVVFVVCHVLVVVLVSRGWWVAMVGCLVVFGYCRSLMSLIVNEIFYKILSLPKILWNDREFGL
jgi:hypothetical protein